MGGNLFLPKNAIVYSGSSATKPDASSLPHEAIIFLNDAPTFFGGYWMAIPEANVYQPVNGELTVHSLNGEPVTDNSGTEQILTSFSMPAGLYIPNGTLELDIGVAKSAVAETCVIRVRVGTTGTIADTSLLGFTMGAPARSTMIKPGFRFVSSNAISPDNFGFLGDSVTPWANDVTIPSTEDNELIFSVSAQMSGVLNTATLKKCEAKYTII